MTDTPILHDALAPLPGRTPGRCAHVFEALPEDVRGQVEPARDFLDTVF